MIVAGIVGPAAAGAAGVRQGWERWPACFSRVPRQAHLLLQVDEPRGSGGEVPGPVLLEIKCFAGKGRGSGLGDALGWRGPDSSVLLRGRSLRGHEAH